MGVRSVKIIFAGLLLLALGESAYSLWSPHQRETDADWMALAAQVRSQFRAGDLITFAPYWADQRGRQFLGDMISPRMAGRPDTDGYARIWEVSLDGSQSSDTELLKKTSEQRIRSFHLRSYEKSFTQTSYDFTDHFSEADVSKRPALGERELCNHVANGFLCGAIKLESRTLEVEYQPRRGILAPVLPGATAEIGYPNALLGQKLVGYTAMADFFSRKNAKGVVSFRVFIDGQEKFSRQHKNDDGWLRFEIDTAAMADGEHAVRFEISAADPAWRTFGFHAEARR